MKKGIGDKVMGWFIAEADAKAKADAKADARAKARTGVACAAPAVAPGGQHDASAFAAVYRGAGVADAERERLAKVVGLLESLPADASAEVKYAVSSASAASSTVAGARTTSVMFPLSCPPTMNCPPTSPAGHCA